MAEAEVLELTASSSEDEEEEDEEDSACAPAARHKRQAPLWQNDPGAARPGVSCHWPPDPAQPGSWPAWSQLRHTRPGNPHYGPRMQLFSSTGWHLALYDRRRVSGSDNEQDGHTFLELSYAGVPGHVRIQCMRNQLYLGMNRRGGLYGETDVTEESTIFIESLAGSYNVYLSRKYAHLGWYVGLKKSGKCKKGPKTALNQRAVKFLPRRSNIQQ